MWLLVNLDHMNWVIDVFLTIIASEIGLATGKFPGKQFTNEILFLT